MRTPSVVLAALAVLASCRAGVARADIVIDGRSLDLPAIQVGTAVGAPGQTALLPVTLHRGTATVVGVQNDLRFDALTPLAVRDTPTLRPDCMVGDFFGPMGGSAFRFDPDDCVSGVDCGVRALVLSLGVDAIPDGEILYACRVDVDPDTAPGTYPVLCANYTASNPQGLPLVIGCTPGAIEVVAELPTATVTVTRRPSLTPTPTQTGTPCDPACPAVRVGTANGRAGARVALGVRLDAREQAINGVQVDIGFDPSTRVAARSNGAPDCHVNTSIGDPQIGNFSFQPPVCDGGAGCTGLRALVSFDRRVVIPDGSELFTCSVDIAGDARAAAYEVPVSHVQGTTADGMAVPMSGVSGSVVVAGEPSSGGGSGGGGCQVAGTRAPASPLFAAGVALLVVVVRRRRVPAR